MSVKWDISKTWTGRSSASPPYSVEFSIAERTGNLDVNINAPFHDDPAPDSPPGKFAGLGDHEAVQIFISAQLNEQSNFHPYLEVVMGPHGHYMLYFYIKVADFDTRDDSVELDQKPSIRLNREAGRWEASFSIPAYILPEPIINEDCSVTWKANAFAVFGVGEEDRAYLAAFTGKGFKPNFHQVKTYVPLTLKESEYVRKKIDRSVSIAKECIIKSLTAAESTPVNPLKSSGLRLRINTEEKISEGHSSKNLSSPGSRPSSKGSLQRASAAVSIEHTAFKIRAMALQASGEANNLRVDDKFQLHVLRDEFVILHGLVWKRRKWSFHNRKLILTSKPRLLYFNGKGKFKGAIPWTATKPLKVFKKNDTKFDLAVHDNSRTYHLNDVEGGSDRWVEAINLLIEAQSEYVKAAVMEKSAARKLLEKTESKWGRLGSPGKPAALSPHVSRSGLDFSTENTGSEDQKDEGLDNDIASSP